MNIPAAWPQILDFFGTPLVIEPSQGQLSSDAGLLPLRQFDDRIGLTRAFTIVLTSWTARCCHSLRGGKGAVCLGGPSRPKSREKIGPDAPGRQPYDEGFE